MKVYTCSQYKEVVGMAWSAGESKTILSEAEQTNAQVFLEELPEWEHTVATELMKTVEQLATDFGTDGKGAVTKSRLFGLYGIGGYIRDEGVRPDIDLLVLSNSSYCWNNGFYPNDHQEWRTYMDIHDTVAGSMMQTLRSLELGVALIGTLPDEYSDGVTDSKVMLRGTPTSATQKPVDVVYVIGNNTEPVITSFEDFEARDISADGQPLGRLALAKYTATPGYSYETFGITSIKLR